MNNVACFLKENKKYIFYFLSFFLPFILLGLIFPKWGFFIDDAGNILHSRIKNFSDFFKFFSEENIQDFLFFPDNLCRQNPRAFFAVIYRPLVFIYFYFQSLLFRNFILGYFLTTIALHSLNTLLLFRIISFFGDYYLSFIAALFFAFHSSLYNWLGWISAQQYHIEVLFILLLILFLKKYLKTKNIYYYFISCFFLLFSLFTRESGIILPVWILFAIYFYQKYLSKKTGWIIFLSSIKYSVGYWFMAFFYIIERSYFFPFTSNTTQFCFGSSWESFLFRFKNRFFDLVSYVSDLFGFCWLLSKNQFLKGSLILFVSFLFVWLFIKNKYKVLLLFWYFSLFLFSWVNILTQYRTRFLYLALPFWAMIIFWNIRFFNGSKKVRKIALFLLSFFIVLNCSFLISKMRYRERVSNSMTESIKNLVKKKEVSGRPLCFVGLPDKWFCGMAQTVWFCAGEPFPIVYYDESSWCWCGNEYFTKENFLNITFIDNELRLTSSDTNKMCIGVCHDKIYKKDFSMGKMIINGVDNQDRIYDVSFFFDQKYLDQKILFVGWDYKNQKFVILK